MKEPVVVPSGKGNTINNNKKNNRKGKGSNAKYNAKAQTGANGRSNPNRNSNGSKTDDQIKQIVGSVQFPPYIGVPMPEFKSNTSYPSLGIPTVCEIPFMTTYGYAHGIPTDTLNTAAIHLHSMIVSKLNRATKSYDANDLMVACICCDSIITVYNYFKTLVSQVMTYTSDNRALPRITVEAMGFDFEDIRDNINDIRVYLEIFSAKLNSLQIPKIMNASDDHLYLTGNVFCDENSVYPQIYVFRLMNYYVFDQVTEPGKTIAYCKNLTPVSGNDKWKTVDIVRVLDEMYNSLFTSYDFGNMLADLRTAMPDVDIILQDPTFDAVNTVYDKDVLMAFHNSTPATFVDALSLSVKSAIDSNYAAVLEINPRVFTNSYGFSGDIFIDVSPEYQNPDGIYTITKWTLPTFHEEQIQQGIDTHVVAMGIGEGRKTIGISVATSDTYCGTEILMTPRLHFPSYDRTNKSELIDNVVPLTDFGGNLVTTDSGYGLGVPMKIYEMASLYTMFDYLPLNPCVFLTYDAGVYHFAETPSYVIGLKDAVTTLTYDQIGRIHGYRIMNKVLNFTK